MLSFEEKCAIFDSYPELKKKKSSNGRINYEYQGSRVRGKNVGIQLTANGKGYVVGKYLDQKTALKYDLNETDDINITKFSEERLRILIGEVIDSMSNRKIFGWDR
ncbi:hypothetical protein [Evansella tamaricis]|uniref:Uncharacterized protein n=1 Tax=Evansella tamaricis TaxID=2069301 RepID=A0ABS6JED4_9BACI|nr:hypothetical protein [Evansella tamaricis]MBU9712011.1 hypothetical protein [Evansella tamaricis]